MSVAPGDLSSRQRRLSLGAMMVHMLGIGLTLGLIFPLTSVAFEAWGEPAWIIGVAGAMAPVAILLFMPVLPGIAERLGAVRAMLIGCLIASMALIAMYFVPNAPAWILARFVIGAGLAMPWLVGDVWINTVASEDSRGKVIGAYVASLFIGFSAGPILLDVIGIDGFGPHALGIGALCLAVAPLLVVYRFAPPIHVAPGGSVLASMKAVPVAAAGAAVAGFTEGTSFAFLPVWGLDIGLNETMALRLLTVFIVGGIALQLVSGIVADRFGRQKLLCAVGFALPIAAIVLQIASGWLVYVLAFVAGGLVLAIYGLSLTLLGQRFAADQLAMASAAYLVLYQIGSVAGPLVTGAAMDLMGSHGLMVSLSFAGVFCGVVAMLAARPSRSSSTLE